MIPLRDGTTTADVRLDRLVQFDERSRAYAVATDRNVFRSYTWRVGKWLDQGREGACVGFSRVHALVARPQPHTNLGEAEAQSIYKRAQQIDPWPGENYEGTSVLAGIKAAQELGLIESYRWAFTLEQVITGLCTRGPAVMGLAWYQGMFAPDAKGFIRPTGSVLGGHAILAHGIKIVWKTKDRTPVLENLDLERSYVKFWNSWGPGWGQGGTAKMTLADLDRLRRENGEVSFAVETKP